MLIPKTIHFIWFGGKEKPSKIKKCMKTWKRLKGYKFIEWNESNFDINSHPFVKKAYEAKKWAFVSDYVRAYAIYKYGGIYIDTDVFIVGKMDNLLNNRAFVGFENPNYPFTAVFGAEKGHPFVKKMLDYYDGLDINFKFEDNNTISVSNILINDYKCQLNNAEQILKDDIKVYPDGVLCNPSKDSITIHVFLGSWLDNKLRGKFKEFIRMQLNNKFSIGLFSWYKKIHGDR